MFYVYFVGELFPELWNFYAANTTANDSFVAGVDGSGYVFVHGLMASGHAPAYVARAAHYMSRYGIDVVDVGVAGNKFAAVTTAEIERYKQLSAAAGGSWSCS